MILRVNQARVMLDHGATIADTVFRCGFCDQSHLTRYFGRMFGVAPGRYARIVSPGVPRTRRR